MRKSSNISLALILAFITILFSSVQINAQVGKQLVVNRFTSDPDNLQTHIVISDLDGVGPNLKITIFNEDGRLVYERYEALNAFGKLDYKPLQYLNAYQHGYNQNPKFRGSVRIESDGGNIIAQYWEDYKDNGKNHDFSVMASAGPGTDKLICQHFVSNNKIDAEIVISNTEMARPVTVELKFYSDNGGLVSVDKKTINANGVIGIKTYKATKGLKMSGTAYIKVIGAGKVTGEYRQISGKEKSLMVTPLIPVNKVR